MFSIFDMTSLAVCSLYGPAQVIALFPGHTQILSRRCGEKSGVACEQGYSQYEQLAGIMFIHNGCFCFTVRIFQHAVLQFLVICYV